MITKLSQYWLPTQKEIPSEAETLSHQLMLRAGLIRQSAVGVYTWLPLGLRVLQKVEQVVREEMNRAGAIETLMPMVQNAELWQESGRWNDYGPELLRFQDRHQRNYCLGPTHEEVITDIVRRDLNSSKQLPINIYQIQTKFRDEIRPRFGVMRAREFLMKDAYSFHLDSESLQKTYDDMYRAYSAIFTRLGLRFVAVEADNGSIGGLGSHEFQVLAATGEDSLVIADDGSYAANLEKAIATPSASKLNPPSEELRKVATPNSKTINALVKNENVAIEKSLKTLFVTGTESALVALVLRGDHELNEIKAENLPFVAKPLQMADEALVKATIGAGFGSLGVIGLTEKNIPVVVDTEAALVSDFVCGANEDGFHYFGVNWERDVKLTNVFDIRNVQVGDLAPNGTAKLEITRGIEVGHIFQLGYKYSEALNLFVTGSNGEKLVPLMGCYGIGVSRVVAAAIEQNHDERGIIWTKGIAPFQIAILPLKDSEEIMAVAEDLAQKFSASGIEVLIDDRGKRAGVMFADMDLIGIPHRIVISDKTLAQQKVEYKARQEAESRLIDIDNVIAELKALV